MNVTGWTNRGVYRLLEAMARGVAFPATFRLALIRASSVPSADTNLMSDLTEVTAGNGYTSGGGAEGTVTRDATGFDTLTEDDALDRARIMIRDVVWTASGGPIPLDSVGARYVVMTDANGTVGSREVWAWWDLGSARVVSSGQPFPLVDLELRLWAAEAA